MSLTEREERQLWLVCGFVFGVCASVRKCSIQAGISLLHTMDNIRLFILNLNSSFRLVLYPEISSDEKWLNLQSGFFCYSFSFLQFSSLISFSFSLLIVAIILLIGARWERSAGTCVCVCSCVFKMCVWVIEFTED